MPPRNWFISDTHFNHAAVIEYCRRPFPNIEEMNAAIVQRVNEFVRPEDILWVLGDIVWGNPSNVENHLRSLNGYKKAILGNHDPSREKLLKCGFDTVSEQDYVIIGAHIFWLAHIPNHNEDDKRGYTRPPMRPGMENAIPVCGHVHAKWRSKKGDVNVGLDAWAMTPVSPQQIVAAHNATCSWAGATEEILPALPMPESF
jgi:calcineurin-like phosphoesterase family protein